MTEPNRFDFRISALNGVHVAADDNGQYVRLTDYVALQQENIKLHEELESVKAENKMLSASVNNWIALHTKAKAELASIKPHQRR